MRISKEFTFEASHILPRHPGKCHRLHGHSYKVTVGVDCTIDPKSGFVMDYGDLKSIVSPFIDRLDHRHLNEFIAYPSAENIAVNLGKQMHAELRAACIPQLEAQFKYGAQENFTTWVAVQETANTSATWCSDDWAETESKESKAGWMPPDHWLRDTFREKISALEAIGK